MQQQKYINLKRSKMVYLTFTMIYPSNEYLVSANMMFEVTAMGQIYPTRFDVYPFKLPLFNEGVTGPIVIIDSLKVMLVL